MQNFGNFLKNNELPKKEWLVIGKGPSFSGIRQIDTSVFNTIALNHSINDIQADFSHAIDIDVILDCADSIYSNSKFLIVPLFPHINNRPTDKTIKDFFSQNKKLKAIDEEGRLIYYNSSTSPLSDEKNPIIPVRYFSADAVISLLAYSGFKKIRTIGVDGGSKYSEDFSNLNKKTLLSNGQKNFDSQFKAIARTVKETGALVLPMDLKDPIRIFVGSQKEQITAVKVLEYSIKKHLGFSSDVFPLHDANIPIPIPKDAKNRPRTPFSFQRFIIPQLCQHQGRAIYLDSDMQVFVNILDLWNRSFGDANILSAWSREGSGRIPQFSVMLLDCASLEWNIEDIVNDLDSGKYSYEDLMYSMVVANVDPIIEPEWNSLEHFEEGKTKLIHYTDMNEQPWLKIGNKNGDLWLNELKEAIAEGFISLTEIVDDILAENIRPSIFFELRKEPMIKKYGINKTEKMIKNADKGFIPPHRKALGDTRPSLKNRIRYSLYKLYIARKTKRLLEKK